MTKLLSIHAILLVASGFLFTQSPAQDVPLPTPAQLRYQQYEQIMFLCLDPCTWQGREYDNHSMPLTRINPSQLNTDQWCEVARSWGARLILFVAKHTGGFCWWNTETSDYGVRNIPWRNGVGDVLADLSASCRKFGLGLGIYVYPGDETWGAGIGSGGKTSDPAKQEGYNRVFRQQMTEVLTKYGPVQEVWFDGSCIIDVSDILTKYATDAVILQGPMANIRWVGNEDGIAPYPNWYMVNRTNLATGVSTALHSDPDGDAYAPVEMDVPLLKNGGHKWFWAPGTDNLLLTTDQLMDLYYRSVGRGGVLLLNSTPDTTGLIPASHLKKYTDFGKEIRMRFGQPLKSTQDGGKETILSFSKPTAVNHVIIQEDIANGQRVRKYIMEGEFNGKWISIREGSSIGQKRIESFEKVTVDRLRLTVTESVGKPDILHFSAFNVPVGLPGEDSKSGTEQFITLGSWNSETFSSEWKEYRIDLTPYLTKISQYELKFDVISYDWLKEWGLEFKDFKVEMYGKGLPQAIEQVGKSGIFRITRSQQTDKPNEFPSVFLVMVRTKPGKCMGNIELKRIGFQ
jgi:alpha-L-fucosidase